MAENAAQAAPVDLVDPDPFAIALGLLGVAFGAGSFVETRRTREFMQRQERAAFRAAWFAARRSLIHAMRTLEEFETYALEEGFEQSGIAFGRVRLVVSRDRASALRRLHAQAHTTATRLSDAVDELSDHLGPEHRAAVDEIAELLSGFTSLPRSYGELIGFVRQAVARYQGLLDAVDAVEGFTREELR